jgi:hypothetical protein
MLRAVEEDRDGRRHVIQGKMAIAELAEAATGRLCGVLGGGLLRGPRPLGTGTRTCGHSVSCDPHGGWRMTSSMPGPWQRGRERPHKATLGATRPRGSVRRSSRCASVLSQIFLSRRAGVESPSLRPRITREGARRW